MSYVFILIIIHIKNKSSDYFFERYKIQFTHYILLCPKENMIDTKAAGCIKLIKRNY